MPTTHLQPQATTHLLTLSASPSSPYHTIPLPVLIDCHFHRTFTLLRIAISTIFSPRKEKTLIHSRSPSSTRTLPSTMSYARTRNLGVLPCSCMDALLTCGTTQTTPAALHSWMPMGSGCPKEPLFPMDYLQQLCTMIPITSPSTKPS